MRISDDEVRAWQAKAEAERYRHAARHAELLKSTSAVVRSMAELHGPVVSLTYSRAVCDGCDMDGYECESPEWPCRTWLLLDETVT